MHLQSSICKPICTACCKLFPHPYAVSIRRYIYIFLEIQSKESVFHCCCFVFVSAGHEPEHTGGLTYWCSTGGIYPRRWRQWSGCWQELSWNPGNRESGNPLSRMASTCRCGERVKTQWFHWRRAHLNHNIHSLRSRLTAHSTDTWLWQHIDLWQHRLP